MNFVHQPYIEPHMMNPMMSREGSTEGIGGRRTLTPQQETMMAEQSHYGKIAPEIMIAHHPDAFFHIPIQDDKGGRKSGKAVNMLIEANAALGLGLTDEQIAHYAKAPIAALLTPGQKLADQGSYRNVFDALGQASGIHPGRAAPFRLWRKGKEGSPEDLAAQYAEYKQDPTQWGLDAGLGVGEKSDVHGKHRGHARRTRGAGYGGGTLSSAQDTLGLLGGAHEHGLDLNNVWSQHAAETGKSTLEPGTLDHNNAQTVRGVYEAIAAHRIANNPELASLKPIDFESGHPEAALNEPMLPRDWQSVPSEAVMATHFATAPVQPEQPEQPAGQRRLDDYLPELFNYSEKEYTEAENRLLKAMEDIQMNDARKDPLVLKLLPLRKRLNLNNHDDVMIMASRLEITPQDVHSINHTQGDWVNIAKTLQVPPAVVGSVKVVFGE
tara:strand:- start:424 stop:1740 length:1317 start_codon:yes stop_codon:yes gene_type:complete